MKKKMKHGFTLAEVLIALTIIGVIAAITVPALIQRTNKQEYVTALQKAYSTLSQAANMIIAENGSPKCADEGWGCSSENIYKMFKKYLINAKDCGTGTGCFEQNNKIIYQKLGGGNAITNNIDTNSKVNKLILADGTQIYLGEVDDNCLRSWKDGGLKNACGVLLADINGVKKPNEWGRDVFFFVLKENGLFPAGCDIDNNSCGIEHQGAGCACKVLREGAMNY